MQQSLQSDRCGQETSYDFYLPGQPPEINLPRVLFPLCKMRIIAPTSHGHYENYKKWHIVDDQ